MGSGIGVSDALTRKEMIVRQSEQMSNGDMDGAEVLSHEDERALLAPYYYLCKLPGKNIRAKLAQAFNHWLRIDTDKLQQICDIVQMLHNASLMIDDIEDGSVLRRGSPVAHTIYGTARTINAANYVYFLALQRCLELNHPKATAVFTEHMLALHRGQGKEIYWRDTVTCPNEEQYRTMVQEKTGGLFGLAVSLMQLFSNNRDDYRELIKLLGLLFQIRDDYANLLSTDYHNQKTFAEDLTEGKFSFPIIYGVNLERRHGDDEIINLIRQKPTSVELKHYCIDALRKLGAFEYTQQVLLELDAQLQQEIDRLGGNAHLCTVLNELRELYASPPS